MPLGPDEFEPPRLQPVRPRTGGAGFPLNAWTVSITGVVALLAFVAGIAVAPPRSAPASPAPSAPPVLSPSAFETAPSSSTGPGTTLPPGVYRVDPVQATEIGRVAAFFAAYDAGQLGPVLAALDAAPHVTDCDYRTGQVVSFDGRAAVEAYLRDRFADHDQWAIRLFNENPDNDRLVGIEPLMRENDTLLRLGVPGAVKRDFGIALGVLFAEDHEHITELGFGTVGASPGIVARLCQP